DLMNTGELRRLFLFDGLSNEQLGELAAVGEEVRFTDDQELFREGDPADFWWVLLEGRVDLARRAGREEAVVMRTMDRPGLWAGGFTAWDDASSYLAPARGSGAGRMLRVPSDALGKLVRAWFPFSVHMITGFFQTVRTMDSLSRQRESLIALGRLAAGLAHELNNPASASTRAVDALLDTCETLLVSFTRLAEHSVLAEDFVAIDALRRELDDPAPGSADPLATADREDALYRWLDRHDVDAAWRIAPTLAAAGVDVDWCERAADVLQAGDLEPGLDWVASTLANQALLADDKEPTGRISA